MKAIIENGKVNSGIQSCFIAEYGVGIVFHNIDLIVYLAMILHGVRQMEFAMTITSLNLTLLY